MKLVPAFRRLWRHPAFRRLVTLRLLSQAADGTLQVGMASYILFSPQSQATAWSIAGVLALTLLPFTVIGPFVSPLLDRWSRRNVALYSDIIRASLALVIGAIIFSGATSGIWSVVLFGALLVAMSINRFMLAGLSAGLQHTVDQDEYLTASSIVPTIGPLGVVIGAVLGFAARFGFADAVGANRADAVIFVLAALMFLGSVLVCRGFAPSALGPLAGERAGGPVTDAVDLSSAGGVDAGPAFRGVDEGPASRGVASGLADAWRHLRSRGSALVALALMTLTRLLFGLLSVAVILAARHLWNPSDRPNAALADLTVWGLATGAGFLLAAPFVPVLTRRLGLGRSAGALLLGCAVVSAGAAFTTDKAPLYLASFLLGLGVQSFKVCVDTIVQAHVDEGYKGRVFTFYDMGYNGGFVLAGIVGALTLPPTGVSVAAFLAMAVAYAAAAAILAAAGRRLGPGAFEKGTGSLISAAP